MKKYILVEQFYKGTDIKGKFNAGNKAVKDIIEISLELGYEPLYIVKHSNVPSFFSKVKNQINSLIGWSKVLFRVRKNDILLIQCPIRWRQLGRKTIQSILCKKIHIVSLIHDVEDLRNLEGQNHKNDHHEFLLTLQSSEYFIIHNNQMKKYFENLGISSNKLISLDIFDYLVTNTEKEMEHQSYNNTNIVIAGNLDFKKSPYIKLLSQLNSFFELYGPNYTEILSQNPNIHYNGSFNPDELPNILNGKYGLVWDGPSVNTCSGNTGNYLRYNNPHKVSLYTAATIPIIIWDKAAMADFIISNKLGITVSSLDEIPEKTSTISKEDYSLMKESLNRQARKLKQGYYTKRALQVVEKNILSQCFENN